ncbi:hypothetical protein FOA52_004778 [Chlamydomonas sp. UWO 241]|nr:hypothetical protein FOA52_004778 [Chlamydomonas sp. UWO 241]
MANEVVNPLFVGMPPPAKEDKAEDEEQPRRRRTCCGIFLTRCCCLSILLALLLAAVTIAAVMVAVVLTRAHDTTTFVVVAASDSTSHIEGQELLSIGLPQLTYTGIIWGIDPALVAANPGLYNESMRDDIAAMFSVAQRRSLLQSGFVLDPSRVQIDDIKVDVAPGSATPVG